MNGAATRLNHVFKSGRLRTTLTITAGSVLSTAYFSWHYRRTLLAESGQTDAATTPSRSSVGLPNRVSGKHLQPGPGSEPTGKSANNPSSNRQPPPSQRKGDPSRDAEGEGHEIQPYWGLASTYLTGLTDSVVNFDLAKLRDAISDFVVPTWVRLLPGLVKKLQDEMSMAPWSLGWEIWEEAHDPEINPEIVWQARVRISPDLCQEEHAFLRKRRVQTAKALARYLDIPEVDVHPDDVPVIAMCGSGGGLRALVAGASSYLSAQHAGLFDCVTYTAGVSGSCWLQSLYYSSIGQTSHDRIIRHLKDRLGIHIAFPPAALSLLSQAPTNKFLLSGIVEKLRGVPDAEFGLVDVYGLLLAARLMVPRGELNVSDYDLKVSNQRYFVDYGDQPLPLYTAVRHEILEEQLDHRESAGAPESSEITTKKSNWFQWFEWTPYEFYCEELEAGIPTWAVGRKFDGGENVWRENGLALPEIKVPLMMGIWGSAFCATLSHYYHEVQPMLKSIGLAGLDSLLADKDEDLIKTHPLDPASIPNYALGLRDQLPSTCPESIHNAQHLRLMDAGMSNNLPIYPLLRPGRDVDVIIAFDASANAPMDNWIQVAEGYAKQRGIKGWPIGAGWPPRTNEEQQTVKELEQAQASSEADADRKLKQAQSRQVAADEDLGHCTVWVGTATEAQIDQDAGDTAAAPPSSSRVRHDDDDSSLLTHPDAGITVVYFPFLANDKVPGVDPLTSDFMSTWNFVYTPQEIDQVVSLAKANFEAGEAQTKRTIQAVYERKKNARLAREREAKEMRRRWRMRRGQPLGKKGEGDHFS